MEETTKKKFSLFRKSSKTEKLKIVTSPSSNLLPPLPKDDLPQTATVEPQSPFSFTNEEAIIVDAEKGSKIPLELGKSSSNRLGDIPESALPPNSYSPPPERPTNSLKNVVILGLEKFTVDVKKTPLKDEMSQSEQSLRTDSEGGSLQKLDTSKASLISPLEVKGNYTIIKKGHFKSISESAAHSGNLLRGVVFYIAEATHNLRSDLQDLGTSMGAQYSEELDHYCSHLIVDNINAIPPKLSRCNIINFSHHQCHIRLD